MKIIPIDDNVKNVLVRHVEHIESKFFNFHKIVYDVDTILQGNDPIAKAIINLAIRHFINAGIYVNHNRGELVYEKNQKNEKNESKTNDDDKKIKCDNDLYYFQKYHTCMFLLECGDNNFFNIYPKYDIEHVRFPLLTCLCGFETNKTVEQIFVKKNIICVFKGDLYYQDLSKKHNFIRITVRMEPI